jgi:thiosulfate/3-mercaptopyruvate sulfurtransferase
VAPLIGVTALARALAGQDPPTALDVRWRVGGPPGIGDYRAGHLPGAAFVDLDQDLAGSPGPGGRHPLPEADAFQAAMRRVGVSDGRAVVVYDEADSLAASRAWWTLRYYGHEQVRVLDGGYRAWVAAGLPVAGGADAATPGDFTARPGHMPLLGADGAAALARVGRLLDARAGERYRGEVEPMDPVAGHIPGAISAPTAGNVTSDGHFRSAAELRERFAALGLVAEQPPDGPESTADRTGPPVGGPGSPVGGPGSPVGGPGSPVGGPGSPVGGPGPPVGGPGLAAAGAYCGSGVTAAHEVLALEIASVPAALYVGSWSHWVTSPARPIATGPRPG